jgi:Trk K+ transport system NAD-binding subunit
MIITIIEGGELCYTLARILRLFDHKVNVIRQESGVIMNNLNALGVNTISGAGVDAELLSQPEVSKSDVFIVLMDNDLDNLESCLYIKYNFTNKKTITRVNNPKYAKKYEQVGIDIAFDSAFVSLNTTSLDKEKQ